MTEKEEYQADARWYRTSEPIRYANQRDAFVDALIKLVEDNFSGWPDPILELAIEIMKDRRG